MNGIEQFWCRELDASFYWPLQKFETLNSPLLTLTRVKRMWGKARGVRTWDWREWQKHLGIGPFWIHFGSITTPSQDRKAQDHSDKPLFFNVTPESFHLGTMLCIKIWTLIFPSLFPHGEAWISGELRLGLPLWSHTFLSPKLSCSHTMLFLNRSSTNGHIYCYYSV